MTTRDTPPIGAPCWADLMTSDVPRAREFYGTVFGWSAEEPNPDFGGYFNLRRDGVLVAGGMPTQEASPVTDIWSVYLASDDAHKTAEAAQANGGQVMVEPMDVMDLGTMAVLSDNGGAVIGVWRPGTHQGFGVHNEPGAPSWFELQTRDYDAAVGFYRDVFHWETHAMSDTPEFRYTVLRVGEDQLAGIMDASAFLPEGVPNHWSVYYGSADVDATVATVTSLGGSVVDPAQDTPYGRLATVADPMGARFKLVTQPAG